MMFSARALILFAAMFLVVVIVLVVAFHVRTLIKEYRIEKEKNAAK